MSLSHASRGSADPRARHRSGPAGAAAEHQPCLRRAEVPQTPAPATASGPAGVAAEQPPPDASRGSADPRPRHRSGLAGAPAEQPPPDASQSSADPRMRRRSELDRRARGASACLTRAEVPQTPAPATASVPAGVAAEQPPPDASRGSAEPRMRRRSGSLNRRLSTCPARKPRFRRLLHPQQHQAWSSSAAEHQRVPREPKFRRGKRATALGLVELGRGASACPTRAEVPRTPAPATASSPAGAPAEQPPP